MPFKSDAQRKLCYYLQGKGQAGSWDCDEWSKATKGKKLPEHVADGNKSEKKSSIQKLAECLGSMVSKKLNKVAEEKLPGGVGDYRKPSEFPADVLHKAVTHELEHTTDRKVAEEIAMDHLTEDINYYDKLEKIENPKDKTASALKLISYWAKQSEVTTSPGRGAGDNAANIIDVDSSDGISKAKPKEEKPKTHEPNRKFSLPAARKALRSASSEVFGKDPIGGAKYGPKPQMAKMSAVDFNQMGQAAKGAWGNVGNAFRAGIMGDDKALQNLQADAARPNYSALQSGLGAIAQANPFKGAIRSISRALPTASDANGFLDSSINKINEFQQNFNSMPFYKRWGAAYRGYTPQKLDKLKGLLTSAKNLPNSVSGIASGIRKSFEDAKSRAAESEGQRLSASYMLPVVNFLRNNPWAKWVLGGLGLYGGYKVLGGLFGGGQPQYPPMPYGPPPIQGAFNQGYMQNHMGYQNPYMR